MNWYKIAKKYNQEIMNNPDFAGFHCQKRPISKYDGIIPSDDSYAETYYLQILDSLPYDLKEKANVLGLLEMPDKYSEEFDVWQEEVHSFLEENNIRWIFVSMNKPLEEHYGPYRYYVLLPESEVFYIFDDPGVNDRAYAYVYDGNKITPKYIELDPEEDGYEDY